MRPALTPPLPSDRAGATIAYTAALLAASRAFDASPAADRRAYREFQSAIRRARELLALDRRRN